MIHNLGERASLVSQYVAELRDTTVQGDRLRFRANLRRLAQVAAYEISRAMEWRATTVQTPLAPAAVHKLAAPPVLATILRAGLAMHEGLLDFFDGADSAFISAYRDTQPDGSFTVKVEYLAAPSLTGRTVIVSDPMLATGTSLVMCLEALQRLGPPAKLHLVAAIATPVGLERVQRYFPEAEIWTAAIDPELDARSYIVPGLGDAGDLAFGTKVGGE